MVISRFVDPTQYHKLALKQLHLFLDTLSALSFALLISLDIDRLAFFLLLLLLLLTLTLTLFFFLLSSSLTLPPHVVGCH